MADRQFLHGEISVLVATESYELGVDNPNISQIIRIGCPRNLGVFLQEVGRAGRKPNSTAKGWLLFNEYIDDKRLGQWLKSSLSPKGEDPAFKAVKLSILDTYTKAWRFIYSIYNGKCLSRALAYFYGGVNDNNPPTCFVANSPLCMVCEHTEEMCEVSIDIKDFLLVLLNTIKQLCTTGFAGVTKTLLISVLFANNETYVRTFEVLTDIFDSEDTCWGSGISINGTAMSQSAWHKVLYVAVHLGLIDLNFTFRPFENHYEVHRKYILSSAGNEFLQAPVAIMSLDPHACFVDRILGVTQRVSKRCNQNRGKQLKPRIVAALEECQEEGTVDDLKLIGFERENDTCIFFKGCFSLPCATKDPHYLLESIQLSRTQAGIKEMSAVIDGVTMNLMCNRSYCSGVKMCGADDCTYTVSTKQRVNRCKAHPKMGLLQTGPCSCYIAYFYPLDPKEDGRRWFVVINAESTTAANHLPPSEWKLPPKMISDIVDATKRNIQLTPKEIQKGAGMDYRPMQVSLAASHIGRIRAAVKKGRHDVDKVDHEKVNPFAIIASFPSIKERVDQSNTSDIQGIDDMIGKYQLDGDDAYSFGRDRQFAWFQAPFQAYHWAKADVLFADIDYTGCHHFPYLLNVVCKNTVLQQYMACGRVLLNRQDRTSIGKALSKLECNIKTLYKEYNISRDHKEILLDFDEVESNAFVEAFGKEIGNILRGCSVHFFRSAMRVAKLVNLPTSSQGYHIFMSIAKKIPDEPSPNTVMKAFDVLCGLKSFEIFPSQLPPDLKSLKANNVDTSKWGDTQTWVDWWSRPQILKKLTVAFSSISIEDWQDFPGTNNPVESINRQSTPENVKSVSLKPLIEHFYLEDRGIAIMQIASSANVTISYQANPRKRRRRPAKSPEKKASLSSVPKGTKAIGCRVNVEFYEGEEGESYQTTKWYKGTIIAYSKRGHVVTFDGYGPEHNETIKQLKKSVEKGEVRLL